MSLDSSFGEHFSLQCAVGAADLRALRIVSENPRCHDGAILSKTVLFFLPFD